MIIQGKSKVNDTPCTTYEGATGEMVAHNNSLIVQISNPPDSGINTSIVAFVFTNLLNTPMKIQFFTDATLKGRLIEPNNIIQRNLNCRDCHRTQIFVSNEAKMLKGRYVTTMVIPPYYSYNLDLHEHIVLPEGRERTMKITSIGGEVVSANVFSIWNEYKG